MLIGEGNHDITLDAPFYATSAKAHNKHSESPSECLDILRAASPSILFLQHQSALVRLCKPDGPNTVFKVFGSPYSQSTGNWAFLYEDDEAERLWSQIPLDADVVVTHTPPRGLCDGQFDPGSEAHRSMGCEALRKRFGRVRPYLAVCGHVHQARGFERVRWADTCSSGVGGEEEVVKGVLPPQGSKKQSLVDLTGKRASRLDNDGFSEEASFDADAQNFQILPQQPDDTLHGADESSSQSHDPEDQARRRETCIVNAAITATNWPHRGGRAFHAGPIVVDLELPVWTESIFS